MQSQQQPNGWSCLPTAFAIVLGIPIEKFLLEVGHDGSEVWWPELNDPFSRKAFHIQEMVLACDALGHQVTCFEPYPESRNELLPGLNGRVLDHNDRVQKIMAKSQGVLIGLTRHNLPHAVAWDGKHCIDNNILGLEEFQVREYWRITPATGK